MKGAQHVTGRPLRSHNERRGAPADLQPEGAPVLPGHVRCELCDVVVGDDLWASHVAKPAHKRRENLVAYKSAFDEAAKDKHGVTVSHGEYGVDFGIVEVQDAERGVSVELKVQMIDPSSGIKMMDLKLSSTTSPFASTSSYVPLHTTLFGL